MYDFMSHMILRKRIVDEIVLDNDRFRVFSLYICIYEPEAIWLQNYYTNTCRSAKKRSSGCLLTTLHLLLQVSWGISNRQNITAVHFKIIQR